MNLYRVVVDKTALHSYIEKGYRLSKHPIAEYMGKAWDLLIPEDRADLTLLEIEEDRHRALNTSKQAYAVRLRQGLMTVDASLVKVDILEQAEWQTFVAPHDTDHPEVFETDHLAATPHGAAMAVRQEILSAIKTLRANAEQLEKFLVGLEAT